MSADRRELDWSAASARLLFDVDDAVFHDTVRTPSRRGGPLSAWPNPNLGSPKTLIRIVLRKSVRVRKG